MSLHITQVLDTPALGAAAPIWALPEGVSPAKAGAVVGSFLDTAATSFGRATHYNSREEQQKAELAVHEATLALDRDLYALLLRVPGVTDRARQIGLKNLLGTPRGEGRSLLDGGAENRLVHDLVAGLPAPRIMKLFDGFRAGSVEEGVRKANNARTRKLILGTLLSSERLPLWSVKYRVKMRAALTHAWGKRLAGVLRSILARGDSQWTDKERSIVRQHVDRFAPVLPARARACVGFVLGNEAKTGVPLIEAYAAARRDLSAGAALPPEVLEGIRSVYHKGVPSAEVIRLTAQGLTKAQRMLVQKRAAAANVDVKMDPTEYDAVRLYVYAFEMGMTDVIARALVTKAREAAAGFPARYGRVGILLDASASMWGSAEQKLRPMATALAVRDMLQHVGHASVVVCGGAVSPSDWMLVHPSGDTSLAEGLLDLVDESPDVIFVLSDGYENRPQGRFGEVVAALRALGVGTPILQLDPVFSAESGGVRELAAGLVPALPVERPTGLGLSFLRGLIQADPVRGINAVLQLTLTRPSGGKALNTTRERAALPAPATPVEGGAP